MQKFLVASAILAVAVSADNILCEVTNAAAATAECANNAIDVSLQDGVTWTDATAGAKKFATLTYTPAQGAAASCDDAKAAIDATCAAAINVIGAPSADQTTCLAADATQGVSKACALADDATCTDQQFCENFDSCNSAGKCAEEPATSKTVNCIAANKATGTACTAQQAVDFTLADGVTFTPAANAVTITYTSNTTATCADVGTVDDTLADCITALGALEAPSADQTTCLAADATQGASKACALADDAACTAGQFCENFDSCNSAGKCAEETTKTINCIATNKATGTACTAAQAADFTLADGVTFTPAANAVTITYTPDATTAATCKNLGTVDDTLADCITALGALEAPSTDQTTCMGTTATQGVAKACGLADGATCTTQQFCAGDFVCNSKKQCAAEPVTTVEYVWANIPSTDVEELKQKAAELFPADAAEGNPCSGLGLTFTVDAVYSSQENAFITASGAIPANCLAQIADLTASTAAQAACHKVTGCGIETCMCEKGNACVVNADGSSNCLSGLNCKTDGTEGATAGVCNSGVMASAALAVAAAVLAVLF